MIESIKKEIKESILTKWIGCFVASVAVYLPQNRKIDREDDIK